MSRFTATSLIFCFGLFLTSTDADAFCYKYRVSVGQGPSSAYLTYVVSREGFFQTTDFHQKIKDHVELTGRIYRSISGQGGRTSGPQCSKSDIDAWKPDVVL